MDEHPLQRHTIATPRGDARGVRAVAGEVLRTGTGAAAVVAAVLMGTTQASAVLAQSHGPAHGTLVISGGAETSSEIYDRFIALAGGPDALILVVPTSGNGERFDDS